MVLTFLLSPLCHTVNADMLLLSLLLFFLTSEFLKNVGACMVSPNKSYWLRHCKDDIGGGGVMLMGIRAVMAAAAQGWSRIS